MYVSDWVLAALLRVSGVARLQVTLGQRCLETARWPPSPVHAKRASPAETAKSPVVVVAAAAAAVLPWAAAGPATAVQPVAPALQAACPRLPWAPPVVRALV